MKLKRFLLRYYPPGAKRSYVVYLPFFFFGGNAFNCGFVLLGVILEYELRDKSREMKEIDLLHLTPE
jgi:dynein assembly factor with WDR repeat domains 1